MPVTLRPKSLLRLDVYQAGMVAHEFNAITYLNARLLLLTILTLTPLAALAEDPVHDVDEVFMAVLINGQTQGTVVILRSDGRLFSGAQDLRRWHLRLPNTAPLTHYSEDFFVLDALAGLSYKFDESSRSDHRA